LVTRIGQRRKRETRLRKKPVKQLVRLVNGSRTARKTGVAIAIAKKPTMPMPWIRSHCSGEVTGLKLNGLNGSHAARRRLLLRASR